LQDIVIQLIISGCGIIGSILAVTVVLAKKVGNGTQSNGQKRIDTGLQKQVDSGAEGTKSLGAQF
jgi:hypothetical protein